MVRSNSAFAVVVSQRKFGNKRNKINKAPGYGHVSTEHEKHDP